MASLTETTCVIQRVDGVLSRRRRRDRFAERIRREFSLAGCRIVRGDEPLELREQFHPVPAPFIDQTGIDEVLHGERLSRVQAPVVDPSLEPL